MQKFICRFNPVNNKRVVTVSFIAKNETEAQQKLRYHFNVQKFISVKRGKLK